MRNRYDISIINIKSKRTAPHRRYIIARDSPFELHLIIISVLNFQLLQQELFFILRQAFTIKHFIGNASSLGQTHHNLRAVVAVEICQSLSCQLHRSSRHSIAAKTLVAGIGQGNQAADNLAAVVYIKNSAVVDNEAQVLHCLVHIKACSSAAILQAQRHAQGMCCNLQVRLVAFAVSITLEYLLHKAASNAALAQRVKACCIITVFSCQRLHFFVKRQE